MAGDDLSTVMEISPRRIRVYECPKWAAEGYSRRRNIFKCSRYNFSHYLNDLRRFSPDGTMFFKLVSDEPNGPDGVKGVEANILIIDEWVGDIESK